MLCVPPWAGLGGVGDSVFTDDAIRIEKYYDEYGGTSQLHFLDVKTAGAVSVHINSNRNGNGRRFENWLDYAVGWCAYSVHLLDTAQEALCGIWRHAHIVQGARQRQSAEQHAWRGYYPYVLCPKYELVSSGRAYG